MKGKSTNSSVWHRIRISRIIHLSEEKKIIKKIIIIKIILKINTLFEWTTILHLQKLRFSFLAEVNNKVRVGVSVRIKCRFCVNAKKGTQKNFKISA